MADPRRSDLAISVMGIVRDAGYEPAFEMRGKHAAVVWTHNGQERVHIIPLTPSDHRSAANSMAQVKRTLRADRPDSAGIIAFTPRVIERDGLALINSRDVADAFEKEHRHVLRDIDNLLKNIDCPELGGAFFKESMQPDGQGILRRTFDMTRDGFSLLAMGFTGAKALQFKLRFIEAFNAMERALERTRVELGVGASMAEIANLKSEFSALTDLVLEARPQPTQVKKGTFIRPSVLRKLRRAG